MKSGGIWNITGNFYGGGIAVAYGFRALKTLLELLVVGVNVGDFSQAISFEDDINAPYFDNGNDMFTDQYIVPIGLIKQKFAAENIIWSSPAQTTGGNCTYEVKIYVNGAVAAGVGNIGTILIPPAGTSGIIPSIVTDYLTLNSGDIVLVKAEKTIGAIGGTQPVISINLGGTFSNSFEV